MNPGSRPAVRGTQHVGGPSKSREMPRSLILGISVGVSVLMHVGAYVAAPDERPAPPPRPKKVTVRPVPVQVRQDLIRKLERPEPEPQPKPIDKPPETPKTIERKVQPPKPKQEPPKPQPKQEPKPPPSKPVEPPKELPPQPTTPAEPAKPKPFVLKNVALKGGVAVQTGDDSNLFGDPTVSARGFVKGVDAPTVPGAEAADGGGESGGQAGPAREKVVITQPKALNDVKGQYPQAFRDLRRVVRVELMLTIGSDGAVRSVKVRKGAEQEFNDAAIRAVNQLKFDPATRNGVPIAFNLKWTVVFIPEGT